MPSPAELTILVLLVTLGVGLWTVLDRLGQVQRDLAVLKREREDAPPEA